VAVEARQTTYLNLLNRALQLPAAFDKPVWPRRICETMREVFITSAPRPYGPCNSLEALCMRLPGGPTPPNAKHERSGESGASVSVQSLCPACTDTHALKRPARVRERPAPGRVSLPRFRALLSCLGKNMIHW
jgi:hypothetical protein